MTSPIEPLNLVPHPRHVPTDIRRVTAWVLGLDHEWLRLRWRVDGARALVLPQSVAGHARADGLWQTTCFEAFVMAEGPFLPSTSSGQSEVQAQDSRNTTSGRTGGGPSEGLPGHQVEDGFRYVELNLSPSGCWNAYDFTAYRSGMAPRALARAPEISLRTDGSDDHVLTFDAAVPRDALPALPCRLGLCAVLEEQGGIKSYWALAHRSNDAPDFHAASGFTARVEPPSPHAGPRATMSCHTPRDTTPP